MNKLAPTVFVIDDDRSVREAVGRLIRSSGLQVSLYASARDYLDAYDPNAAGCLVLDLVMPGSNGLALQDVLMATGSAPPIVFLTGHADVPASVQAMKHGAVEFLCKPVDERALIDAVCSAVEKDRVDRIDRAELAELRARLATLTPREFQVVREMVEGKANKAIAAVLGTVEKTIKVHRARAIKKMKVRSLAALVHIAVRVGIS
jgi:FixJ family two-component response regulator